LKRLLIAGSAAVLACCGGAGNSGPVTPTTPVVATPAVGAVTSLQVTGNTNLTSVGETSQLTATAGFESGAIRDVTSETIWHSFNPNVATISATGLLTAVTLGRTLINASFQIRAGNLTLQTKAINREVVVLPSGTFILRGRVNEPGNLDISNARFEVVDGPQAGRFTMTNSFGLYELFGLSGDIRVTVTKDRYIAQTRSVSMTQDRVLDFEILPAVPPIAISGDYHLTFTASQGCASQLVEEARTRTYRARINQDRASVEVLLSDANFALEPSGGSGNGFRGRIEANSVTFSLADWYSYGVVEQLGPATYLSMWGTATATVTLPTISGGFNGGIELWEAPNGFYAMGPRQVASCSASDHQFTFTRQ
jgi:hypothetical protein